MPEHNGKLYELFTMYRHPIPLEMRQDTATGQIQIGRHSLKGETYSFMGDADINRFVALVKAVVPETFHDNESIARFIAAMERDCNDSRADNPDPDLIYSVVFGNRMGRAIFNLGRMQHDEFERFVLKQLDYFMK